MLTVDGDTTYVISFEMDYASDNGRYLVSIGAYSTRRLKEKEKILRALLHLSTDGLQGVNTDKETLAILHTVCSVTNLIVSA